MCAFFTFAIACSTDDQLDVAEVDPIESTLNPTEVFEETNNTEEEETENILTKTPSPTLTSEPTEQIPTSTPEINFESFSLDTAIKNMPDDIFSEVFFPGGGGAGVELCPPGKVGVFELDGTLEGRATQYDLYILYVCSDQRWDEEINISIRAPDNTIVSRKINTTQNDYDFINNDLLPFVNGVEIFKPDLTDQIIYTSGFFVFIPSFESLEGNYTFSAEINDEMILDHMFEVYSVMKPKIHNEYNNVWLLRSFEPNEKIKLLAYQALGPETKCVEDIEHLSGPGIGLSCFVGWTDYQVNEAGELRLQLPNTFSMTMSGVQHDFFSILGESSGLVSANFYTVTYYDVQLKPFSEIEVFETLNQVTKIASIQRGSLVRVIGEFGDKAYQIQTGNGKVGWVLADSITFKELYTEDLDDRSGWVSLTDGAYFMGVSNIGSLHDYEDSETPIHSVILDSYWIQRTEVSNKEYQACVADGKCSDPALKSSATRSEYYENPEYDDFPVIHVNYTQATDYCNWIGGRLPTEAEWEYAARSSTDVIDSILSYFVWGNDPAFLEENAGFMNFGKNVGDTTSVYEYAHAAPYIDSLLNIHGNVWEWTSDWFDEAYYSVSPESNPTGPEIGTEKVLRGGGWSTSAKYISLTNRHSLDPNLGYDNVGFRCVTTEDPLD